VRCVNARTGIAIVLGAHQKRGASCSRLVEHRGSGVGGKAKLGALPAWPRQGEYPQPKRSAVPGIGVWLRAIVVTCGALQVVSFNAKQVHRHPSRWRLHSKSLTIRSSGLCG